MLLPPAPDTKSARDSEIRRNSALSSAIDAEFSGYNIPHSPGMIIAVLAGGSIIHLAGYGCSNAEFNVTWTPQTKYTFFSLTKSMVASVFIRLFDAKKVDIDTPVVQFLPEFSKFEHEITIGHLLNHTSGIWQDEALWQLIGSGFGETPMSLAECRAMTLRQPRLAHRPGSYYYYNDAGMRVAADVLAKVTGKSFAQAMQAELFAPAGMRGAFVQTQEPSRRPMQATSYFLADAPLTSSRAGRVPFNMFESSADGGVCGSMEDLIAYVRFISAGPPGARLLDRLTAPVEYRPGVVGHYRTCFHVMQHRGLEFWSHTGLFGKRIIYLPVIDSWILVMRNALEPVQAWEADGGSVLMDYVLRAHKLTEAHLSAPGRAQVRFPDAQPQHFSEDEIAALSGTFVEPESCVVLRIAVDGSKLRTSLFGEKDELVRVCGRNDDRGYTSYYGPQFDLTMDAAGALSMMHTDWEAPRALKRVTQRPALTDAIMADLAGTYVSTEFGSVCHVRLVEGAPVLQIGTGLRASDCLPMQPVDVDLFEGQTAEAQFSQQFAGIVMKFERSGDQVVRLVLFADNVRGLAFRRVQER